MTVSIGVDGRLYFHDLDPAMIDVALAMNPDDGEMRRRRALCRAEDDSGNGSTGSAD